MSRVVLVLALAGSAMLAFGSWGLFTEQGRRHYDEMAGIIPVAAVAAGALLSVAAALIAILTRRRGRSKR
jgi:TRAP-type C4-dicarboxylate transport system permease small subunit